MSGENEQKIVKEPSLIEALIWRILMYALPIGLGFFALYAYPDAVGLKVDKVKMLLFGVVIFSPFILMYDWKWLKKHRSEINRFSLKREWFEKIEK